MSPFPSIHYRILIVVIPEDDGTNDGFLIKIDALQTAITKKGESINAQQNNDIPSNPSAHAITKPIRTAVSRIASP